MGGWKRKARSQYESAIGENNQYPGGRKEQDHLQWNWILVGLFSSRLIQALSAANTVLIYRWKNTNYKSFITFSIFYVMHGLSQWFLIAVKVKTDSQYVI